MLYSPATSMADGLTPDPPHVYLLDAADLSQRWSAVLEGVRDGVFPKDKTVTRENHYEPGKSLYLSPGTAFAPDRDALYIVHANFEQLTTVDFDQQRINTVEVGAKLSWFEKLLSLSAGIAHAKGEGTSKQIVVSPDGKFLYVVGVNNTIGKEDPQGNLGFNQTSLGLEILQANDGSRLKYLETDATEICPSRRMGTFSTFAIGEIVYPGRTSSIHPTNSSSLTKGRCMQPLFCL